MLPQKRFSVVEILIFLLACGIFASVLPPLFQRLSENPDLAKCRGNLYLLGTASHLYASENEGRLPENTHTPSSVDGNCIADGRMCGRLLSEESGGYGDVDYIRTTHPLFCPSLS